MKNERAGIKFILDLIIWSIVFYLSLRLFLMILPDRYNILIGPLIVASLLLTIAITYLIGESIFTCSKNLKLYIIIPVIAKIVNNKKYIISLAFPVTILLVTIFSSYPQYFYHNSLKYNHQLYSIYLIGINFIIFLAATSIGIGFRYLGEKLMLSGIYFDFTSLNKENISILNLLGILLSFIFKAKIFWFSFALGILLRAYYTLNKKNKDYYKYKDIFFALRDRYIKKEKTIESEDQDMVVELQKIIDILSEIGEANKALQLLKKYEEKYENKIKKALRKEIYVIQARAYFIKNEYDKVKEIFYEAKDEFISYRLYYLYSLTLYRKGNYQAAIDILEEAINEAPDNSYLYLYLGLSYIAIDKKENIDKGFEKEKKALDLRNDCPLAMAFKALIIAIKYDTLLAFTDKENNEFKKAKKELQCAFYLIEKAIEISKYKLKTNEIPEQIYKTEHLIYMDIRGYINYKLGKTNEALEDLMYCINKDRNYSWPYFHLGLLHRRLGNLYRSEYYFRLAIGNQKSNKTYVYKKATEYLEKLKLDLKIIAA